MQCFFVTSEGWTPSNTFEVVGEIYRELSPEERGPCGNDDFAASMAWRIQRIRAVDSTQTRCSVLVTYLESGIARFQYQGIRRVLFPVYARSLNG